MFNISNCYNSKRIIGTFFIVICVFGCQTTPSKITIELESSAIDKTLSNDECIIYAFKIEGWAHNRIGGYLAEFKQQKTQYTIDDFFLFLRTKISLSDWYWEKSLPRIKNNYFYLKDFGYKDYEK